MAYVTNDNLTYELLITIEYDFTYKPVCIVKVGSRYNCIRLGNRHLTYNL